MTSPSPGSGSETPPQILVVDDEEIVLVALRDSLRQMGHHVETALTVAEGLRRLRQQSYAVVFTDHQMPQLTGLEFLAQVRELQPDASRILITAVLNLGTVIDAINRAEVLRFLIKPWRREALEETVTAALQRHADIQRAREELATARRTIATLTQEIERMTPR